MRRRRIYRLFIDIVRANRSGPNRPFSPHHSHQTAIGLLIFLAAIPLLAKEKPLFIERRDVPLQLLWIIPSDTKAVRANAGLMKMDTYRWRVYPEIGQKLDRSDKGIELVIDLTGPINFSYAGIVVAVDGQTFEIPAQPWHPYRTLANDEDAVVEVRGREDLVRRIAGGKEVYVTVMIAEQRYSVKLSEEQLGVFGLMVGKYDSLDPH